MAYDICVAFLKFGLCCIFEYLSYLRDSSWHIVLWTKDDAKQSKPTKQAKWGRALPAPIKIPSSLSTGVQFKLQDVDKLVYVTPSNLRAESIGDKYCFFLIGRQWQPMLTVER